MTPHRPSGSVLWAFVLLNLLPATLPATARAQGPTDTPREILIGVEYALRGRGKIFADLGIPAVKHLPSTVEWGKMQKSPEAPVDFTKMDSFVREYQEAGFQEIVLGLKSLSRWASKDAPLGNLTPKPEYVKLYGTWIRSVVERYDGDGQDDMPGLRRPVRYFEIGVELSTFEPEPIDEYLAMLERAYRAAHEASDEVIVAHVAVLPTTAFNELRRADRDTPEYQAANRRKLDRRLADMRAVLGRPDIFDAVNFHALGDPYEIEYTVAWIKENTKDWKEPKPILISDTTPNGLVGWGPATIAKGDPAKLGMIIPPGTEADRPRLAAFFRKLVDADDQTLRWTHAFVAEDMVQKVVISAEQGITLIDTSFTEDLPLFKTKLFMAGSGLSPWGGMVVLKRKLFSKEWNVVERRPVFYAVRQVQQHIRGYTSVRRLDASDEQIRLYRFDKPDGPVFVAWLQPGRVVLPGEPVPTATLALEIDAPGVTVEEMIDRSDQPRPRRSSQPVQRGRAEIEVSPRPGYLSPAR